MNVRLVCGFFCLLLNWSLAVSAADGLALRTVEVPPATAASGEHPIDRLLAAEVSAADEVAAKPVSDRVFMRRISLDLIGLLPAPADLEAFTADDAADKRERLSRQLLDDRRAYADHWLAFWSDALRNAYQGTGFIDNGRSQITEWLYGALYRNQPYDRFVHELIAPVPGSEGFTKAIKWRGVVNESQRREIQVAQTMSQVFLGLNLKCASCHDSFVNDWKLEQAYALSAVFADQALEVHHCDKPIGITSDVGFLYPELGTVDPQAGRDERQRQLAGLVVHRENGRFARTIVNRLWAAMMGRGLHEPLDDLDKGEPRHPELLEWLAADFVDHGYDLKHTLALIATSRAYQLPSVDPAATAEDPAFRGPLVKRMSAEQFLDAVHTVTQIWPRPDAAAFQIDGRNQGGQLAAVLKAIGEESGFEASLAGRLPHLRKTLSQARWIWGSEDWATASAEESVALSKTVDVSGEPDLAVAVISVDNAFTLIVNGKTLGQGSDWSNPPAIDISSAIRKGANEIVLTAVNGGDGPNAAGAIGGIIVFDETGTPLASVVTDGSWVVRRPDDSLQAFVIGDSGAGPWNLRDKLTKSDFSVRRDLMTAWGAYPWRASLTRRDTLQAALGRPNREQVVTRRDSKATLLQALELANGESLDGLIQAGAKRQLEEIEDPKTLARDLMLRAIGRPPEADEQAVLLELVGSPPSVDGVADALWTVVMLPEFQLIR